MYDFATNSIKLELSSREILPVMPNARLFVGIICKTRFYLGVIPCCFGSEVDAHHICLCCLGNCVILHGCL